MHMYDNHIALGVPVAGLIFKSHDEVRTAVEAANRAVYDAVVTMVQYCDPMAPVVFGIDAERLEQLASANKFKIEALFQSGVTIFGLRMADPAFENVLGCYGDSDGAFRALLNTFPERLPLRSLISSDGIDGTIPVSNALFDNHDDVLTKLDAASRAVYAAIVRIVESRDPLAPMMFGTDAKFLQMIASAGKSMMCELFMTGVPIFSLRLPDDVIAAVSGNNDDPDAFLRMKLAAFL